MTTMTADELEQFLARVREDVDRELARILGGETKDDPGRLREAMRYAVLGGGKRLRPAIVLGACSAVGGTAALAYPAMASVELLHAYTLIHDDLPAMDDDTMRRGRPTVHVAFGEATAILAGDALLTEAFLALAGLRDCAEAVRVLGARTGAAGLLGGQARDLAGVAGASLAELERIHEGKTGALFSAAAELGGIAAGAGAAERARLADWGMAFGVAFQHRDDLADAEHQALAEQARARLAELAGRAKQLAAGFGPGGQVLAALADWVGA
jgi:geranylgeranyl pyrophosphate synthase